MGFFNSCWETFLQLASYAQSLDSHLKQEPLHLPSHFAGSDHPPTAVGVSFIPQNANITCQYPSLIGWTACNSASDRSCWLEDPLKREAVYQYNISTDCQYWNTSPFAHMTDSHPDESFSPPGITREVWRHRYHYLSMTDQIQYHLNVSVSPISPDGYIKPLGQIFNDQYPGPLLEACWGDEVVVHVTNSNPKDGSTIHWHGIRQLGTNQMDGVNGE